MHGGDLVGPGQAAAANCPQGLVSDDEGCARHVLRHAVRQLLAADRHRLAGRALRLGFANADQRQQPGKNGGARLIGHLGVGFAILLAAFGMANDDGRGSCVAKHRRAELASEGTTRLVMAGLPANGKGTVCRFCGTLDQGGGRADQDFSQRRLG